jgi:hypothetical protein
MPPAAKQTTYGGISSTAVERATGKSWAQWFTVLDRAGAAKMTHAQIAEHLASRCAVPPWWSQMVTVGYEQARGRRVKHQKPDGFSISATRTLPVPLATLYAMFADARRRGRWLDESMVIRKQTRNKSMRITWPDDTNVNINFYTKGEAKSSVQVEHDKLASAAAATKAKTAWKRRLDALAVALAR